MFAIERDLSQELLEIISGLNLERLIQSTIRYKKEDNLLEVRFFKSDKLLGMACIDVDYINEAQTNLHYLAQEAISDFLNGHFDGV